MAYQHKETYYSWANMKRRCNDTGNQDYARYGGRGITYDANWERFEGFNKDMGATYVKGKTLDRVNNNKGYCKENCRWATASEQSNNRSTNRKIKIGKETKNLSQWVKHFNLKSSTVRQRFYTYKWDIKKALQIKT